jgi:preprotein translocase subunit SecE
MVKEGNTALNPFWRELFSVGVYKRSQGRIARQVTFAAMVVMVALGAWSLKGFLTQSVSNLTTVYVAATAVLVLGMWFAFRLVNMPRFADFLIAVEAEMNKVSWPTRTELVRSSIVVIFTIFGLMFALFMFDIIWRVLLSAVGVFGGGGGG